MEATIKLLRRVREFLGAVGERGNLGELCDRVEAEVGAAQEQTPAPNKAYAEMDKAVRCLALELPEAVWIDVNAKWQAVRKSAGMTQHTQPAPTDPAWMGHGIRSPQT